MAETDCQALLAVIQAFLRSRPHRQTDLADLFDLLRTMELAEKRLFWTWLGEQAPNIKKWLMAKGAEHRRVA